METLRCWLKKLFAWLRRNGKHAKYSRNTPDSFSSLQSYSGTVRETVGQGRVGMVQVGSELWRAELLAQDGAGLPPELEPGRAVRIVRQEGLKLWVVPAPVEPVSGWEI